jgi:hypothetical protein
MQDVAATEGRTVLFVSHNESAVRRLCSQIILLAAGKIAFVGSPAEAFQHYRGDQQTNGFSANKRSYSSKQVKITDASIEIDGFKSHDLPAGTCPNLVLKIDVLETVTATFEMILRDQNSVPVMFGPIGLATGFARCFQPGSYVVTFQLNVPYLAEGRYSLDLMVVEPEIRFLDYLEEAIILDILPTNNPKTGWTFRQARGQGCILLETSAPTVVAEAK